MRPVDGHGRPVHHDVLPVISRVPLVDGVMGAVNVAAVERSGQAKGRKRSRLESEAASRSRAAGFWSRKNWGFLKYPQGICGIIPNPSRSKRRKVRRYQNV